MSKETKRRWKELKPLLKGVENCNLRHSIDDVILPEIDNANYDKEVTRRHINAELFTFNVKIIRKNGKIYSIYSTNEKGLCHVKVLNISQDVDRLQKNLIRSQITNDLFNELNGFIDNAESRRLEESCSTKFDVNLFSDNLMDSKEQQQDYALYNKNEEGNKKENLLNKLETILNNGGSPYIRFMQTHDLSPKSVASVKFYDDRFEYKTSVKGEPMNVSIKYEDVLEVYKGRNR
jgi:hypothetical protein